MKTAADWKADEQELIQLKKWREELKADLATTSRRIHILSTSIREYKKKEMAK